MSLDIVRSENCCDCISNLSVVYPHPETPREIQVSVTLGLHEEKLRWWHNWEGEKPEGWWGWGITSSALLCGPALTMVCTDCTYHGVMGVP